MKKYVFLLFILLACVQSSMYTFSLLPDLSSYLPVYEERWDWSVIDTKVNFPHNFIMGPGDSALQTEGVVTTNGKKIKNSWTKWQKKIVEKDGIKQPRFVKHERVKDACQRWTRYPEDIQRARDCGFNAYRFSIEWSKIEPENGIFDEAAIQHYIDFTHELIAQGLQPIPTLFHHAWPLWFDYENHEKYMGKDGRKPAFEDARNIQAFVEFAVYVFNAFKKAGLLDQVKLWLTFNEPVGYAMAAYIDGKLPPGKKYDIKECGIVTKNMLDAHIAVYDALKKIDPSVCISFAHMMQPIQPYHPYNPLDKLPAQIFDYLLNDVALEYFKTGNFYWLKTIELRDLTPYNIWNNLCALTFLDGIYSCQYNPQAVGKLDFVGVNYYTHTLLKMFRVVARPDEKLADGYEVKIIKALYPEGFYQVLKKAATLNLPILITENGFAATDSLRDEYLKKHLYVVQKAIDEGIDIRGYLFWTLTDCFGWNSGHHSNHGIFAVDFTTQKRTFRKGAQYLLDVVAQTKRSPHFCPPLGA